jgi:hypothetical protein
MRHIPSRQGEHDRDGSARCRSGETVRIAKPAAVALVLAVAAPLAFFDPAATWWFPSCPLFALTGWQCPLCGSLRALHALLTGSLAAAIRFNPLTTIAALASVVARERLIAWGSSARGLAAFVAFGLLRNVAAISGLFGR